MIKASISDPRPWTSLFLSASGALVLGYVGYQYGAMYIAQQRLQSEWERQQGRAAIHAQVHEASGNALMRISSPKIGLAAIVVEGSSTDALSRGPGHMEHTAFPGQKGNTVITGHRDTFFRHIAELAPGDTLMVEREGKTYVYQVTGKKVVAPTDLSVIRPTSDAELTLITCHPTFYLGPAPERMVVFSHLLGDTTAERLQAGDDNHDSSKSVLKKAAGVH